MSDASAGPTLNPLQQTKLGALKHGITSHTTGSGFPIQTLLYTVVCTHVMHDANAIAFPQHTRTPHRTTQTCTRTHTCMYICYLHDTPASATLMTEALLGRRLDGLLSDSTRWVSAEAMALRPVYDSVGFTSVCMCSSGSHRLVHCRNLCMKPITQWFWLESLWVNMEHNA